MLLDHHYPQFKPTLSSMIYSRFIVFLILLSLPSCNSDPINLNLNLLNGYSEVEDPEFEIFSILVSNSEGKALYEQNLNNVKKGVFMDKYIYNLITGTTSDRKGIYIKFYSKRNSSNYEKSFTINPLMEFPEKKVYQIRSDMEPFP